MNIVMEYFLFIGFQNIQFDQPLIDKSPLLGLFESHAHDIHHGRRLDDQITILWLAALSDTILNSSTCLYINLDLSASKCITDLF
jgi:hypothetical protein